MWIKWLPIFPFCQLEKNNVFQHFEHFPLYFARDSCWLLIILRCCQRNRPEPVRDDMGNIGAAGSPIVKALVEEHLWLVPIVCKKYQKNISLLICFDSLIWSHECRNLHYTLYSPAVCMGYLCILRPS
jgi:hypothetical protein